MNLHDMLILLVLEHDFEVAKVYDSVKDSIALFKQNKFERVAEFKRIILNILSIKLKV